MVTVFFDGFTQGGGVVYDSDVGSILDPDAWSLFWGSSDPTTPGNAAGANVGVSMCFGYFSDEVEGGAVGWDANVGVVSPTIYTPVGGGWPNGITVGAGAGLGVSASTGTTEHGPTFWEIYEWATGWL